MAVPTTQGVSDATVIEQSWQEPGVFAALYERHAPHIVRYVTRRLGNDLADDVTAETFYRAFKQRDRYDLGRPDARPWLYGIAANVIAQYHRKETRMLRAFARSGADPVAQTYNGQLERVDDQLVAAAMHQPLAAALAAPVNGHPAYWTFKPNPSGQSSFQLRWKYAPNSWAELQGDELKGSSAELTTMAYKVARSATFGGSRPIAMPLHVGGVPGGLTPKRTVLNNGAHGQVSALLEYIANGADSALGVGIVKSSGVIGRPAPNGKLDGHPAFQTRGMLYVYGVDGFNVQINASGSLLTKLNKTGGLVALFHKLTIYGTDPANWTTNPIN